METASYSESTMRPLVWTIGFSGKRYLPDEAAAKEAIGHALEFLRRRAASQHARLTALSSIARGGDVLFAESCQQPPGKRERVPWKCLLPFSKELFLKLDVAYRADGELTLEEEEAQLIQKAEACLAEGYVPEENTRLGPDPQLEAENEIESAYLECGYRTVDESDAMIFLLRADEFDAFKKLAEERAAAKATWVEDSRKWMEEWTRWRARRDTLKSTGFKDSVGEEPRRPLFPLLARTDGSHAKAGSYAIAQYAVAAHRPCLFLNADDPQAWDHHVELRELDSGEWFCDPSVTPTVAAALGSGVEVRPGGSNRHLVEALMNCLDTQAMKFQRQTQQGLRRMLWLHLSASTVAALFATSFDFQDEHWRVIGPAIAWLLALASLAKPAMAFLATRIESGLHHRKSRTSWVQYRVLAEVCRSWTALWSLPEQPLDAMDEEDFPKVKRLVRSLRLLRALDRGAGHQAARPALPDESKREADMREACEDYAENRLLAQARYFQDKQYGAKQEEKRWHRRFVVALWTAIVVGLVLFLIKGTHAWEVMMHDQHAAAAAAGAPLMWPFQQSSNWLQAVAIIAPFYATYALGMLTVLDCRRRALRYEEMRHYLNRLAQTLLHCHANTSRLRLIEHAERMLIEEQHEWFSVTRNYSV